ncbi:MAG TPA: hypothetical protein PKD64_14130 [Pirellulaceae bacterium]|nr:hypothetical protein [Pirellulaceae bacterium]HMO93324.1 hypothetical protein [Pirellulaceae bacterium]HMP69137.1 hypothetical protein [Pirellulaceae bacterium]
MINFQLGRLMGLGRGMLFTISVALAASEVIHIHAASINTELPGYVDDSISGGAKSSSLESTHSEVHPLVPKKDGKSGQLHTFKLSTSGELVAGVSFDGNFLQIYSPELNLINEFPIPIPATAIAIESNGDFVIGGGGKIARVSRVGEVLCESPAPHMLGQSAEEAKEKMLAEYKKQMEEARSIYAEQIKRMQEQIDSLEAKKAETGDEFAKRDQSRLDALQLQLQQYQTIVEQNFSAEIDDSRLQYMLDSQTRIPSLAVDGDDVFVAVSTGRGYEIWRTDKAFENGTKVIEDLSGCCGQFDFSAKNGLLFLAENTKFKVGIYNRDGEHLNGFGSRAGTDDAGFGSCCNPMNVICTSTGDILTAESSIGKIKRFNQAGELVSVIGKARIGGGCKHVALGFDESRNRYYIQYQDKNMICVLLPNAEAELVMTEVVNNRKAASAELLKLDGLWERIKTDKQTGDSAEAKGSETTTVVLGDGESISMDEYRALQTDFSTLEFSAATKSLHGEFSEASEGNSAHSRLFGLDVNGQRPPAKYTLVPQSFQNGELRLDVEVDGGLIEFELVAKLDGDSLTVTFVDEYSTNPKPLSFKRSKSKTSASTGD